MKRATEDTQEFKFKIPVDLMERFNKLYWDPVHNRPLYGERSNVMRRLLERHIAELEGEHNE